MRLPLFTIALLFVAASAAKADTFYPQASTVSFTSTSTGFSAQNVGTTTLSNIYFFIYDVRLDGNQATLTSPGRYTVGTSSYLQVVSPTLFITPSQTDANFGSASSGSSTMAQIPAYLVSNLLAPGQTANFNFSYQVSGANSVRYSFLDTANTVAATPEPSSFVLLGTGILSVAGMLKRRFA